MKPELFTFVHNHSKESAISFFVDEVRRKCVEISPTIKKPKLYNHTTFFPPFWAPPDEMRFLAVGVGAAMVLHGEVEGSLNEAKISGIDYFRNPDNDALIAMLSVSPAYKKYVESWRKEMRNFSHWKFDLYDDEYNPHICIGEEKGLYEKMKPHHRRVCNLVDAPTIYLPLPEIMIKKGEGKESRWEKFEPSSSPGY